MASSFAPAERQYYDQLFDSVDKDQTGMLLGQDALPFLTKSGLPQGQLGEVWALSDPDNNGFLTKESWYRAARIIGWIQKGGKTNVEESLLSQPGPYPSFTGHPPPPPQAPLSVQTTGQRPVSAAPTGSGLPTLTPADRTKFTRIFVGCGPQNGLVSGDKARDVFVKSQLNYDKLGLIWNLADTQQRGSLDLPDFIIGMYLIQSCMANPNLQLPSTLPPGTYEQASGGRAPPTSPIARQNTGPQSPVRPQYTGGTLQPQRTGQGSQLQPQATPPRQGSVGPAFAGASAFGQSRPTQPWDVTPEAKATSDRFFAQLDQQNRGVIEGDVAVPFMLQSQLDEGTLATIWDLSDIRHEGKLDRDMFAVAMHLINQKLSGKDLPASLPNSLVPPALRQEFGGGQQEVLDNGPSSTTKDLFDLFSDEPAPIPAPSSMASPIAGQPQPFAGSAFGIQQPLSNQNTGQPQPGSRQMSPTPTGTRGFVPQSAFGMAATNTGSAPAPGPRSPAPPSDLLGEDAAETPAAVPEDSAEIGNKRNQLENTQRSLSTLEKQQAELQKTDKNNSSQLAELETNLSTARAKHEEVTKTVADLRSRVSDQQEKVKNLNMDFIAAESDLSALRSEKDELEQALLRDKEEVRGLQKRMKEVDEEKGTLKNLLEKLKKEARQQKGMVTIAKKQLSTSEVNRDAAQKDLDDHHKSAGEDEEDEGMGTGAAAALGGVGGAALGAGATGLFGSREESGSTSPFAPAMSPSGSFSPGQADSAINVPLPGTPKALSPVATGASSRSNNPFDRLRSQSRGPAPASPPTEPQVDAEPTGDRSAERSGDEPTSPGSLATGAVVGATTAVGMAAGVAVAGASAVYHAVTGEGDEDKGDQAKEVEDAGQTPKAEEADPFGAPTSPKQSGETDVFGAPTSSGSRPADDTDPFGASSQPGFDNFDSGFGDSFGTTPAPKDLGAGSASGNPDFDSAFADFDDAPASAPAPAESVAPIDSSTENEGPVSPGIPMGVPKSALPDLRPDHERTDSTQAVAPASEAVTPRTASPVEAPVDVIVQPPTASTVDDGASSDEEEEGPEDLDGPKRSYGSTSRLPEAAEEQQSATEEVTAPVALAPAVTSPPVVEGGNKGRRSAPPPPASRGSSIPIPAAAPVAAAAAPAAVDDFDPFGAPSASVPGQTSAGDDADPFGAPSASAPGQSSTEDDFDFSAPIVRAPAPASAPESAQEGQDKGAGPQTSKFDDDDFDFSDMPPAQVDTSEPPAQPQAQAQAGKGNNAFDDEFAGFDDEFESVPTNPNSGSDRSNLSKSFEMVTPTQEGGQQQPQQANNMDEWGMGSAPAPAASGQQQQQPASTFSFDDAFGGDFEPAPAQAQQPTADQSKYAPPPGAPPPAGQTLDKPPLPQRQPSAVNTGPQPDDLEDVKRLCSMGFTRDLAVGALESNGYDFQKALNVLLAN